MTRVRSLIPNRAICLLMALTLVLGVFNTLWAQDTNPIATLNTQAVVHVLIADHVYPAVRVYNTAGQLQTWTCSEPRPYKQMQSTATGWACYDAAIGVFLLDAQPPIPPATAVTPQETPQIPAVFTPVVYVQPEVVYTPRPVYGVVYGPVYEPYPAYSSRVYLGREAIRAGSRIAVARIRRH